MGVSEGQSGTSSEDKRVVDLPTNDIQKEPDNSLDRIQVVSSALRVIPRDRYHSRGRRAAPTAPITTWRRPRQHQFVTKEDRVSPPPIVRVYSPITSERSSARSKAARRIIYYATLPEIVRPPSWYDQRLDYYEARPSNHQQYRYSGFEYKNYPYNQPYPNPNDNEVTRVQSNIIDVTPPRSRYSSTPKFTIIDVDPPYMYDRPQAYSWYRRPTYNDRPDVSLEPVKLEIPTATTSNSTTTHNSTRLLPDLPPVIPVSMRSLSKFIT